MDNVPTFTKDSLTHFNQKAAIDISRRYCCAHCYHNRGIATQLHMIQVSLDDDPDRFIVICTECGGNVASRTVGRITVWFLTHEGQKRMARALEIKAYKRLLERERQKEQGTYHFDPVQSVKDLGF